MVAVEMERPGQFRHIKKLKWMVPDDWLGLGERVTNLPFGQDWGGFQDMRTPVLKLGSSRKAIHIFMGLWGFYGYGTFFAKTKKVLGKLGWNGYPNEGWNCGWMRVTPNFWLRNESTSHWDREGRKRNRFRLEENAESHFWTCQVSGAYRTSKRKYPVDN